MIVVSNTTPLSELAKVGQMNLLGDVFGAVIIPQEVYDELTKGMHPAATAVTSLLSRPSAPFDFAQGPRSGTAGGSNPRQSR